MAKNAYKATPKKNSTNSVDMQGAPDLSVLQGWWNWARDAAYYKHWEYFVIDQYLRGNHNVTVDLPSNTIEIGSSSDMINFPMNKLYANFRAIRNYIVRNKPKMEVVPQKAGDEQAIQAARRANAVLRRDNHLNNARKLNREWVYLAVKYGKAYRQVGYDQESQLSVRWTVDPFNMFFGSRSGDFNDSPYIIKTITRTMGYWRNKYPKANVDPDNKLDADEFKSLGMQIQNAQAVQGNQRETEQTAIGYECWYRLFTPNKLGGYINKCLFTESGVVDFQETPYKEYPFVEYQTEQMPGEIYPDSIMKHLIPPQRLENILNEQLVQYNYIVNRGRYQMPKDSGFEVINAQEGQIIRHNLGRNVQVLPVPPLNPLIQWQIEHADNSRQLIGAYTEASAGIAPFAGASGDLVEALQSGDANSLSEFRENFEDALALEAQLILSMYEMFEGQGVVISDDTDAKNPDQFFAVGAEAGKSANVLPNKENKIFIEDNGGYLDYLAVTSVPQVKVTLTSELGETKQARLNYLSKLVELGLPLSFLLKNLEFPDADDIEQRIAEEAIVEMMQSQMQSPSPEGQPVGGPVNAQAEEKRILQKIGAGGQ